MEMQITRYQVFGFGPFRVIDAMTGEEVARYRTSGMARTCANSLNTGRGIPPPSNTERWAGYA